MTKKKTDTNKGSGGEPDKNPTGDSTAPADVTNPPQGTSPVGGDTGDPNAMEEGQTPLDKQQETAAEAIQQAEEKKDK